ncbi:hypothetical protein FRB99_007806 [Tulasnella sp. 403]|nr:hypothetical protein FRB99_007806 [Tulasnella sp. 403]
MFPWAWIPSFFRLTGQVHYAGSNVYDSRGSTRETSSTPFVTRAFHLFFGAFLHSTSSDAWHNLKFFLTGTPSRPTASISAVSQPSIPIVEIPPTSLIRSRKAADPFDVSPNHTSQPTRDSLPKVDTVALASPLPTPPITPVPNGPYYLIPDFIGYSPFNLRVNPHYQPLAAISEKWLDDHKVHPSPKKRAAFEACNFGLLTAMCYPDADYARFRVLCDYINCLFAFDDLTDEGGLRKDGTGTKKASDIIMNALHHPFAYQTEFRCGQVFASFWGRAVETGCAPGMQRRFLEYTDLYVQAVHEQVLNRAQGHIPTIDSFIELRRDTGALKMCFAMGEFGLNLDLPDEVFECPLIRIMEDCANDVVVLSNDIYSYNIEQAQGDTCNIIEVAMKEKGLDVQGAMDFAGGLVKDRVDLFVASKAQLPSWGPRVDADVLKYLRVCEDWMTGGFHWSLQSERYFGKNVTNVKNTLCVELLPKEPPRGQISIPDLVRAT